MHLRRVAVVEQRCGHALDRPEHTQAVGCSNYCFCLSLEDPSQVSVATMDRSLKCVTAVNKLHILHASALLSPESCTRASDRQYCPGPKWTSGLFMISLICESLTSSTTLFPVWSAGNCVAAASSPGQHLQLDRFGCLASEGAQVTASKSY